jgi:hypothetical protein
MGVLVAVFVLGGAGESAGAATLKAEYLLQSDRASEIAALKLSDLGTGNRFAIDAVGGFARPVLTFQRGSGLALPTAGLVDPRNHSVALVFRLTDVSGYRRIVDFTNGASDNGLYDLNGNLVLYVNGNVASSQHAVFGDDYVRLILTNAATPGGSQTTAYVNGIAVAAAPTSHGFDLRSGRLRFFKDDGSEESAGAVACIMVFDGTLTTEAAEHVDGDLAHCSDPHPLAYKLGPYAGTTNQRLPILVTVSRTMVRSVSFRWRTRCADGQTRSSRIFLRREHIRNGRFSFDRILSTGGSIHVSGKLEGTRATGMLSREGMSGFGTRCAVATRWHARATGIEVEDAH